MVSWITCKTLVVRAMNYAHVTVHVACAWVWLAVKRETNWSVLLAVCDRMWLRYRKVPVHPISPYRKVPKRRDLRSHTEEAKTPVQKQCATYRPVINGFKFAWKQSGEAQNRDYKFITGPWKLKSWSKSSFGLKSAAVKLLKQGSVIFTRFVSLTRTGNLLRDRDVILAPLFSRHFNGPA